MVEPSASTEPITFEFRPLTTALMAITVLTPMTMPRMVRKERRGLRRSASNASPTASFSSPNPRLSRNVRAFPLFRAQRYDRVEPRGFRRGINAEEKSHACRHDQAHDNRPRLNGAWQRSGPRNELREKNPEHDAPHAADSG